MDRVEGEIKEDVEEIVISDEGKLLDAAQKEFDKDPMTRLWLGNCEDPVEMVARPNDHPEHFAPATA